MVTVGYNYYSQCYDLKKKKMLEVAEDDPRLEAARANQELQV